MSFSLEEGPRCTMHFKCSILGKNDQVLRVISRPASGDFKQDPAYAPVGRPTGCHYKLTVADTAGARRADGSIKLRMVVHLYLPSSALQGEGGGGRMHSRDDGRVRGCERSCVDAC